MTNEMRSECTFWLLGFLLSHVSSWDCSRLYHIILYHINNIYMTGKPQCPDKTDLLTLWLQLTRQMFFVQQVSCCFGRIYSLRVSHPNCKQRTATPYLQVLLPWQPTNIIGYLILRFYLSLQMFLDNRTFYLSRMIKNEEAFTTSNIQSAAVYVNNWMWYIKLN